MTRLEKSNQAAATNAKKFYGIESMGTRHE
jgi:hypothetical protein